MGRTEGKAHQRQGHRTLFDRLRRLLHWRTNEVEVVADTMPLPEYLPFVFTFQQFMTKARSTHDAHISDDTAMSRAQGNTICDTAKQALHVGRKSSSCIANVLNAKRLSGRQVHSPEPDTPTTTQPLQAPKKTASTNFTLNGG